jgi:hypothetical protein
MKRFATATGGSPVLHRNSANLMQSMLDEVKASLTILPELQALIPELQKNEYAQLEANIRNEGCRDALLIWQTTQGMIDGTNNDGPVNVLIDGHNRYSICKTHTIDFKVMLREFPSLEAVRDFMIDNQLGRRNLTPEQTAYLRGLKYRNERLNAGRPVQDGDPTESDHNLGQRTQDRLAKEFKVSPRTIQRDRDYSEGIDKLTPALKQDVLSGKQKIAKEIIRSVGRASVDKGSALSLPELLTFSESGSATKPKEFAAEASQVVDIVKRITHVVATLNPASESFSHTCDELIDLINQAKQLRTP